jgi:hypothetical protein
MMGEDFRNRLRDSGAELGFIEDDRTVEDDGYDFGYFVGDGDLDDDPEFDPDDPANDPSQEYTFVRDQAL